VTSLVVPYRAGGKTRLPEDVRVEVALAMLGDVLEAACAVGPVRVVTDDPAARLVAAGVGAETVADPGGGQGEAVAAALAGLSGPVVVVNADLPCATASDLRALAVVARRGAVAIVEAEDGTTNALALPTADAFLPLYGPGSADRFRADSARQGRAAVDVPLPGLRLDVDTTADLEAVIVCAGSRTRALLSVLLA